MTTTLYIKNGTIVNTRKGVEIEGGLTVYNASKERMLELGYVPYFPPKEEESQKDALIRQINDLENSFNDDYKIIKCYEAQLMNRPMPYDYESLINARDAKRAQINALEAQLQALENQADE